MLRVIPLGLALLHRYYLLKLENILAHVLLLFFLLFFFYFAIEKCIFYHYKFLFICLVTTSKSK